MPKSNKNASIPPKPWRKTAKQALEPAATPRFGSPNALHLFGQQLNRAARWAKKV